MFIILTLITLTMNSQAYFFESHMDTSSSSSMFTEGLNPVDQNPLPESDWDVTYSSAFAGNCFEFEDHIYFSDDISQTINQYFDKSTLDCSLASHPNDQAELIDWQNLGIVQKIEFGTETLNCNIKEQNCDINQNYESVEDVYSTIYPTNGVDGTPNGRADVFLYNLENSATSHVNGRGGNGGQADLYVDSDILYCAQVFDYHTKGQSSSYAKTPFVSLKKIEWIPFIFQGDAQSGSTQYFEENRTTIIKGLAPTILENLKQTVILEGRDWE